jgi:putative ABC transport system permease protein
LFAVAVGGLGISSTIGINISERRYETGVLRAIGADREKIYILILSEVLIMGLAGWLAGTILSYPVSVLVGNYFGLIFLHTDLINVLSVPGSVVWLMISLSAALVSGYIPARKAAGAPLREMLSYE